MKEWIWSTWATCIADVNALEVYFFPEVEEEIV
jgi:hypothetical protein